MNETKTIWHPFPQEKPRFKYKTYLVTMKVSSSNPNDKRFYAQVTTMRWNAHHWQGIDSDVVAWAYMPDPYKPPREALQLSGDQSNDVH